jgi:hypothetical protein
MAIGARQVRVPCAREVKNETRIVACGRRDVALQ